MKIHIEQIKIMQKRQTEINKLNIEDIQFFENGKQLIISPDLIEEFEYTGLNNLDFINTGFYKKIIEEDDEPDRRCYFCGEDSCDCDML